MTSTAIPSFVYWICLVDIFAIPTAYISPNLLYNVRIRKRILLLRLQLLRLTCWHVRWWGRVPSSLLLLVEIWGLPRQLWSEGTCRGRSEWFWGLVRNILRRIRNVIICLLQSVPFCGHLLLSVCRWRLFLFLERWFRFVVLGIWTIW